MHGTITNISSTRRKETFRQGMKINCTKIWFRSRSFTLHNPSTPDTENVEAASAGDEMCLSISLRARGYVPIRSSWADSDRAWWWWQEIVSTDRAEKRLRTRRSRQSRNQRYLRLHEGAIIFIWRQSSRRANMYWIEILMYIDGYVKASVTRKKRECIESEL